MSNRMCRSEYAANHELARAIGSHGFPDYRQSQYEKYARACLRDRRANAQRALRRKMVVVFTFLIIAAIYGLVGGMDKTDAERDLAHYCSMVHDKAWPDYRHIASTACPKDSLELIP